MSTAVDKLLQSVMDSTTTASIPASHPVQPSVVTPQLKDRRRAKLANLMKRRGEGVQEDASVIPGNAQVIQTSTVSDNSAKPSSPQGVSVNFSPEDLIPVSVALVAPDTTPDQNAALDPSQVPVIIGTEPTQSTPQDDLSDPLRVLLNAHQGQFKAASAAPVSPEKAAESLNRAMFQVSEIQADAAAQGKAASLIEAAMNGQKPAVIVPQNPEQAMRQATSALRQILG